jgi:putative flippase GtrA
MCNYIATAIIYYTDVSGEFQLIKYCREVYLHNVDVWGFIISYLYSIIYTIELPIYKAKFIKSVSDIIINYCFNSKYAISPIPVDKVINDLRKITIR